MHSAEIPLSKPAAVDPGRLIRPFRAWFSITINSNVLSQAETHPVAVIETSYLYEKKSHFQIRPLQPTRLTRFCSFLSWRSPGDVQSRRNALEWCKGGFKCQHKRIQRRFLRGSHHQLVERDHV